MVTETLGAHLRNLLTPYRTMISVVELVCNGELDLEDLKELRYNNIDALIEFSHSDKMENVLWRNENE